MTTVVASIDANLAYSKVKEFVDIYNSVNSTLDTLTNKGAEGTEKGILARDIVVTGIQRELRNLVTTALPGFEDKSRYISELGIKTERDGSLSLNQVDFEKAFTNEPILFDVMINSIARSSNPAVTVEHNSTVFQPEGGVYSFVESSTDGNSATIGGVSLAGSLRSDGSRGYAALSGATNGLRVYTSGGETISNDLLWTKLLSKLTNYIEDLVSPVGSLLKVKLKQPHQLVIILKSKRHLMEKSKR